MTTTGVPHTTLDEVCARIDTRCDSIAALLRSLIASTSRPSQAQDKVVTQTLVPIHNPKQNMKVLSKLAKPLEKKAPTPTKLYVQGEDQQAPKEQQVKMLRTKDLEYPTKQQHSREVPRKVCTLSDFNRIKLSFDEGEQREDLDERGFHPDYGADEEQKPVTVWATITQVEESEKAEKVSSQTHPHEQIFGQISPRGQNCPPLHPELVPINPSKEVPLYKSQGGLSYPAALTLVETKVHLLVIVNLYKDKKRSGMVRFVEGAVHRFRHTYLGKSTKPFDPGLATVTQGFQEAHTWRTNPYDPGRVLSLPRTKVGVQLETKQEKYFFEEEFNQGTNEYVLNYIDAQLFSAFGTSKDTFMPHERTTDEGPNLDLEDKVNFKGGGIVGTSPYTPKAPDKALVNADMTRKDPRIKWSNLAEGPESGPGKALAEPKITRSDLLGQTTFLVKSGSSTVIEMAKEWDDITKTEERPEELAGISQSAYTRPRNAAGRSGPGGNTPDTRLGTLLGINEAAPGTRFMYVIYEELTKDHDQEMSTSRVNTKAWQRGMNQRLRDVDPQGGMNPSQSMNLELMAVHLLKLAFMAHALASPSPI